MSLPLGAATHINSAGLLVLVAFIALFTASGAVTAALTFAIRLYPAEHAGLVTGIGSGAWSAIVAIAMPIVGNFFDKGLYRQSFVAATLISTLGLVG